MLSLQAAVFGVGMTAGAGLILVSLVSRSAVGDWMAPGGGAAGTSGVASGKLAVVVSAFPYCAEGTPDQRGYVANKDGASFVDLGVGGFLAHGHPLSGPSPVDARWKPLAPQNRGRFKVPTLRNVDKRPSPDFINAQGHNGYFTSLKEIVHFYNARDVLPRCAQHESARRQQAVAALNRRQYRLALSRC